jgi:choline dehydrogenase-like flavoprotein
MLENLGSCVSSEMFVYGVDQLSVVNASIIPLIPAAYLQASMYAIAGESSRHY